MWMVVINISSKRKVKCPHCDEWFPREDGIQHTNRRYYHKDCYKIATKDSREYKELIETICRIWGIDAPTMQMVRQLKLYRDDPEAPCTNKGMQLTLEYYYDLLGNKPDEEHGVGIIPLYYDKAKEQYIKQMEINKLAETFEENEPITVYISPQKRRGRRYEQIDIESL